MMKNFLQPHIDQCIADRLNPNSHSTTGGPKTVTSLAVDAYLSTQPSNPKTTSTSVNINPHTLSILIAQLKVFTYARHNTTAATLSFVFHLLYKHPRALSSIRCELNVVLGPDPSAARSLASHPHLLNQLPYTTAVIKETLRLFPPAGPIRYTPVQEGSF
jgi:hypothetical protein